MDDAFIAKEPIVEGFDNAVTFSLLAAALIVLVSATLLYLPRRRLNQVHPSLISAVNDVRQERLQNEPSASLREDEEPPRTFTDPDRVCPICLGQASFAVLTNCGHLFCCSCFYLFWQHNGNIMRPVRCAVCRSMVSVIMPKVVQGERENNVNEAIRSDSQLNEYNRRFSGAPRPVLDYVRDIPVMIPYMLRFLFSINGILTLFRIRVMLCLVGILVYVLFPFDILPEAVYGVFGFIDDIFITVALLAYAIIMFRRLIANRQMRFDGDIFGND